MENNANSIPHVAVLMASYNGEKYLKQQIDSILAQKNVRVSLFVRDDQSTDNTKNIIAEYQSAGNVFLLPSKPQQLNVTKNFFSIVKEIDLADIDYIAYSDQDDIWLDQKMNAAVTAIQQNASDCYASNLLRGDTFAEVVKPGSFFSRILQYLFNYKSNNQLHWDHYFEAASAGCTLVLNKNAAQYFQQRIQTIYDAIPVDASHDWSTYAITRIGKFKWFIDSNAYIIYRQHAGNAYGTNAGIKGISKLLNLFRSGWYRKHILMIEDLYNNTGLHPDFITAIRNYQHSSIVSRFRVAVSISSNRRKRIHRVLLFLLVMAGYFR